MANTQSGKSRGSIRKTPPPAIARAATPRAGKTTTRKPAVPAIGSAEWRLMVATAAYFRAQARGFVGGSPEQDWLEAEAEVIARLTPARIE